MSKYHILKESGTSFKPIFSFTDNQRQNIWNKTKKTFKILEHQKVFNTVENIVFPERRLNTRQCLHSVIRFSKSFLIN